MTDGQTVDVHVMIDLETWGVHPGCAIRSIGAVAFDQHAVRGMFYRNVSSLSSKLAGLIREKETQDWWAAQSEEACFVLDHDQRDLASVLVDFSGWYVRQESSCIWAHGASFDLPILSAAYCAKFDDDYRETYGFPEIWSGEPWHFRDVRDTRTLFEIAGISLREVPYRGIPHYALDDAMHQAMAVMHAWRVLRPF